MRIGDSSSPVTDLVTSVADGKSLGSSDRAERLAALWVAEDNNCGALVTRLRWKGLPPIEKRSEGTM